MDNELLNADWISPPGETVEDILRHRGITLTEFAERLGGGFVDVPSLLEGTTRIDEELAARLSGFLGSTPRFWLSREQAYRDKLYRARGSEADAAQWLVQLPITEMQKLGWITPATDTATRHSQALHFFGVSSSAQWSNRYTGIKERIPFRTSPTFDSTVGAVAAWLRKGQLEAMSREVASEFDAGEFQATLSVIRSITREQRDPEEFIPRLTEVCAECGVHVVVSRCPSQCRASGASFLVDGSPLIMLSGRHLSDDHFWFTFFHEAAHVLFHDIDRLFVSFDDAGETPEEEEANQFAVDTLIPAPFSSQLSRVPRNHRDVMRFARQVGISPGIIVGQMQFLDLLPPSHLNKLKRKFGWKGDRLVSRETRRK